MSYITIPQLAKVLGLSRVTVFRMVKSGKIPAKKVGHSYIIANREIAKITGAELTGDKKKIIDRAIKKTIKEYGETLALLGGE